MNVIYSQGGGREGKLWDSEDKAVENPYFESRKDRGGRIRRQKEEEDLGIGWIRSSQWGKRKTKEYIVRKGRQYFKSGVHISNTTERVNRKLATIFGKMVVLMILTDHP